VENRAGILYNDTRRPIERDVAQLGRFGYSTKCHGFQSRHPYPSPLGSNEESIKINSNWT
jgi:hypothetical protein